MAVERERTWATSIAVCPYVCERRGVDNADFAARMTFMVILALMRFRDLKVISAGSMLGLGGQNWPLNRISARLEVRYVLTGGIIQRGQTLVFSHMIYDAETGKSWPLVDALLGLGNLHDVGRWVVPRIITAVLPDLQEVQFEKALAKPPSNLQAHDYYLRGLVALQRLTPDSLALAEAYFVRAQRLDPGYASAFAWHARVHTVRLGQNWTSDHSATRGEAERLAETAIALDPANAIALAIAGHMRSYVFQDYTGALAHFDRAIAAGPNEPLAWLLSGLTLAYVGRAAEGRVQIDYALSLSPLDRLAFLFHAAAATCSYAAGNFAEAERAARLALVENGQYSATHRLLATSIAAQGRIAEARVFGASLLRLQPDYASKAERYILFNDPVVRAYCFKHLALAGIIAGWREAAE